VLQLNQLGWPDSAIAFTAIQNIRNTDATLLKVWPTDGTQVTLQSVSTMYKTAND